MRIIKELLILVITSGWTFWRRIENTVKSVMWFSVWVIKVNYFIWFTTTNIYIKVCLELEERIIHNIYPQEIHSQVEKTDTKQLNVIY